MSTHPSVAAMWQAYLSTRGEPSEQPQPPLSAWHFCDNEVDADTCARLVLEGKKRATAPSLWFYESQDEPLPYVGEAHVVTNWAGEAQCVIEVTNVEIVPFDEVSAAHAEAEGEGDQTLAWWRRVHWAYYHCELDGTRFKPQPDMPIVCTTFERVFPQE